MEPAVASNFYTCLNQFCVCQYVCLFKGLQIGEERVPGGTPPDTGEGGHGIGVREVRSKDPAKLISMQPCRGRSPEKKVV